MKTKMGKTIKAVAIILALNCICAIGKAGTAASSIDYGYLAKNAQVVAGIEGQEYYKLDDMLFIVPVNAPRSATYKTVQYWPDGIVRYKFDNQYLSPGSVVTDPTHKEIFRAAAAEWSKYGTITFIEDESATDYYLTPSESSDNSASVGVSSGGFYHGGFVYIRDWNIGTVAHEIGHSLGLSHEHQRADAALYVTAHPENAGSGAQISPDPNCTVITEYDFLSIMHYNQYAFSVGGATITCNAGYEQYQNVIGQRCIISAFDRIGIAKLYGKPEPGLCSITVEVEDAVLGTVIVGDPDGYGQFTASYLTQANPGIPITLTLNSSYLSLFGGWEAENATIDNPASTRIEVTPLGDCVVRVVKKSFNTTFEGTTGTVLTIPAPAAFPDKTAFGKSVATKIGGKPAKIKGANSQTAQLEVTPSLAAGTYAIVITDKANGTSQTCSVTIKPPEIDEATYSGTTLTIDGSLFGKKPVVTIDGKKKSGKTVFNPQSGASTTTVNNIKTKPTTVTITTKAGTATYSL